MIRILRRAGYAVFGVLISVPAVNAQALSCAPRAVVVDRLSETFGEARQSIGISSGDRVVEMFASPETGTWTLTMTLPDGRTCIIGAGEAFERLDEAAMPAGRPT